MINYIVTLFTSLFSACLQFDSIILFMSAIALVAVFSTAFVYLLKGKY